MLALSNKVAGSILSIKERERQFIMGEKNPVCPLFCDVKKLSTFFMVLSYILRNTFVRNTPKHIKKVKKVYKYSKDILKLSCRYWGLGLPIAENLKVHAYCILSPNVQPFKSMEMPVTDNHTLKLRVAIITLFP